MPPFPPDRAPEVGVRICTADKSGFGGAELALSYGDPRRIRTRCDSSHLPSVGDVQPHAGMSQSREHEPGWDKVAAFNNDISKGTAGALTC